MDGSRSAEEREVVVVSTPTSSGRSRHWNQVYDTKGAEQVSRPSPRPPTPRPSLPRWTLWWVLRGGCRAVRWGSFPLRFPHGEEPADAGWHIEGSYLPEGRKTYHANVFSKDRALLLLFLFTDVHDADAPTRIRVGSHLDVPRILAPYGEDGVSIFRAAQQIDAANAHRPLALATGSAGDVFVCHPFLVHAAQPHHGTRPRFLAQPPIAPDVPLDPFGPLAALSPVELAIRRGLDA